MRGILGTGYLRALTYQRTWHHCLAHPCYPVHDPLMVGLGYGATRDLADGCLVQPRAGIQSAPSYHDGFMVALLSQSKQQIVPTVW